MDKVPRAPNLATKGDNMQCCHQSQLIQLIAPFSCVQSKFLSLLVFVPEAFEI